MPPDKSPSVKSYVSLGFRPGLSPRRLEPSDLSIEVEW